MSVTIIDNQQLTVEKRAKNILGPAEQHPPEMCPIRDILGHFGDKWSIFTILSLGQKDRVRFNELKSMVHGISQRMLTVTLRSLEENGVVERHWYPEIPPRVEYCLTPLGRSLLTKMVELWEWASTHMDDVHDARRRFQRAPKSVEPA
ncbi:winged helix-turn-helix transcriptional regulator [Dinghuibacter silviterrae]|uniref:HxlR family transcriptional regulator n=1 Tax=Dinghuibacter silviterrae TaxID=1539049 RepID=A0A4R8DVM3_9BACT|nr:helix-turn-helix domain-containing protein [Dinghuibacter silviterrae]TDX01251.1 HxlR family transcriptional regulator [Dinghuibacter silviterrae]